MKLAYPLTTPEVRGQLLAWSGDPATITAMLRQMGYAAVELFIRDPAAFDHDSFTGALDRVGMAVAAVGTGPVAVHDKLTFTDPDPAVRAAAVARVQAIVDFAARFGAQVNVGKLRGVIGGRSKAAGWRDDAFRALCTHAASRGVQITLEPQCSAIIDNLTTTTEAVAWLRAMNLPSLKLMLDTYHMHAEDACPAASLVLAREFLVHMHVADTRRMAPGRGAIGFPDLLRVLHATGYDRYLTVEINQEPDSASAAQDAAVFLQALLARLT